MAKPKCVVLLTRSMEQGCFAENDLERISAVTDFVPAQTEDLTEETQLAAMSGADIIITGWGSHAVTTEMLDEAPQLALMCHSAGSIKHLVNEAFVERGITVCSAASALAVGVAEFAFGQMLMSMKGVWQHTALTQEGRWNREESLKWMREPHGATVGIVGASWVGREMIRLCKNLDLASILLADPYVSGEEAWALGATKVELDELMSRSDVVSLHTPATEECRHIINARNLALMKDYAIFINTARGMCVDETALIAKLEKGRLLACIDVTDPEPPRPDNRLFSLPNCILTPHIAGAVKENRQRQGALVADEVEAFTAGCPPISSVDLTQRHRIA
jgi:phosphoglycerate dehydrogenase-like enzyme